MRGSIEDKAFLILIVVVSLAFGWILTSFYGAILWGVVIAILFAPLYRRLMRAIPQRPTLAALAMIVLVVMIVILPLTLIAASLTQQAAAVFAKVQSGDLDFVKLFQQILDALPHWVTGLLDRFGVASLGGMQEKLSAGLLKGSQQIAAQALNIGQSTFEFVVNVAIMLYLLFFLFRDGNALSQRVKDSIPLRAELRDALLEKFTVVIRATVKGSLLVAMAQGALGGLIFWILGINGGAAVGGADGVPVAVAGGRRRSGLDAGRTLFVGNGIDCSRRDPDRLRLSGHRACRQSVASDAGGQGHQAARLCGADLDPGRDRSLRAQRLRHRSGHRRHVHRGVGYLFDSAEE